MTGKRDSFSKRDVTIIMTGEEWFALLARIRCLLGGQTALQSYETLSPKGAKAYSRGMGKLQEQLLAASVARQGGAQ